MLQKYKNTLYFLLFMREKNLKQTFITKKVHGFIKIV